MKTVNKGSSQVACTRHVGQRNWSTVIETTAKRYSIAEIIKHGSLLVETGYNENLLVETTKHGSLLVEQ